MIEYGLFNDEGLVEGQFYSKEAAGSAIKDRYSDEDELEIYEVCPDHAEQPRYACEECE